MFIGIGEFDFSLETALSRKYRAYLTSSVWRSIKVREIKSPTDLDVVAIFYHAACNVQIRLIILMLTTSDLSCYLQDIHIHMMIMRNERNEEGLTEAATTACSHQHKICICFLMKMCSTYRARLSSSASSSSSSTTIVSRAFCVQSTFSQNKTLESERQQCVGIELQKQKE